MYKPGWKWLRIKTQNWPIFAQSCAHAVDR